ncbi:MAG: phosphate--acyl-ACP acyltransferase, partial [Actinobacteria bacterium]|nr:phosphate--acyl-ACP acyltransferase [Actinomycetota bacterium]
KGSPLVKETHKLLAIAKGINFIGNVEGRDVMTDTVDVVVTDGFTGNVLLKALEGSMRTLISALLEAFSSTPEYQAHADALLPALLPLYEKFDPETYGGAVLLGVDGVCIISHGSSSSRAILNALRVGTDLVDSGFVDALRASVAPPA